MSKLNNQRRVASSQTHLVLQAYCLTDIDEINPLGIEIWYRTTRSFSIICGIEAIRSVPKKYRTRYPALYTTQIFKTIQKYSNSIVVFFPVCFCVTVQYIRLAQFSNCSVPFHQTKGGFNLERSVHLRP